MIKTRSVLYQAGDDAKIEKRGYPPKGGSLFPKGEKKKSDKIPVAVLVPFFNEESYELWLTLRDLLRQQEEVRELNYEFRVCLILDGWEKASDSMKNYLFQMFPLQDEEEEEKDNEDNEDNEENEEENERVQGGKRKVYQTQHEMGTSWIESISNWHTPLEPGGIQYLNEEEEEDKIRIRRKRRRKRKTDSNVLEREENEKERIIRESYPITVVTRRVYAEDGCRAPVRVYDLFGKIEGELDITLVVKKDNRRKHNSHVWFLSPAGFACSTGADYYFLTDCGTRFHSQCLRRLIMRLEEDPSYASAAAFQRQMTKSQQMPPEISAAAKEKQAQLTTKKGEGSAPPRKKLQPFDFVSNFFGWFLSVLFDWLARGCNAAGYEILSATGQPAYSLFGFMRVIPGPCGLFRRSALEGEPLKNYFRILERSPIDGSILSGNLRLVEDRILTYAPLIWGDACFHPQRPRERMFLRVCYETDAVFYFPQEETFQRLLGQRRRWNNGSMACDLWILSEFGRLFASSQRIQWWRKVALLLLLILQSVGSLSLVFSPVFFGLMWRQIICAFGWVSPDDVFTFTAACWLPLVFWAVFVLRHVRGSCSETDGFSFLVIGIFGAICTFGHNYLMLTSDEDSSHATGFSLCLLLILVVNSWVASRQSATFLLRHLVQGVLFFPILELYTYPYAAARFWQLSWGNRPSTPLAAMDLSTQHRVTRVLKQKTLLLNLAILSVGFAWAYLSIHNLLHPLCSALLFWYLPIAILSFFCLLLNKIQQRGKTL